MAINSEMAKLQDAYNIAVKHRDDLKKELAIVLSDQQLTKWQLEHQSRRSKDYQKDAEKFQMEIAGLKAKKPMIREHFAISPNVCIIKGEIHDYCEPNNKTLYFHFLW